MRLSDSYLRPSATESRFIVADLPLGAVDLLLGLGVVIGLAMHYFRKEVLVLLQIEDLGERDGCFLGAPIGIMENLNSFKITEHRRVE